MATLRAIDCLFTFNFPPLPPLLFLTHDAAEHNQASRYLMNHCTPFSDVVSMRSASSHRVSVYHSTVSIRRFLLLGHDRLSETQNCPNTFGIRSIVQYADADSPWESFFISAVL